MINVLIVEDSKISSDSIVRRLSDSEEYNVITTIENAANAEIVCMRGNIDLILMDICTADDESGLKASKRIKQHYPEIKIILMTSMPEYSFIRKAKDCGCESLWYKEYGNIGLMEVCRRTMNGESIFPENTPVLKIGMTDSTDFTARELEVMRELVLGHKYSEIAKYLHITENTVKFHIKKIMLKTGYNNTLQLVADVVEKRLILPKY